MWHSSDINPETWVFKPESSIFNLMLVSQRENGRWCGKLWRWQLGLGWWDVGAEFDSLEEAKAFMETFAALHGVTG